MKDREKLAQLAKDASRLRISNGRIHYLRLKPGASVSLENLAQKYGPALGLGPEDSMKPFLARTVSPKSLQSDEPINLTYFSYQQTYKGVDVLDNGYIIRKTEDSDVTEVFTHLAPRLDQSGVKTETSLSASDALQAALSKIGGTPAWEVQPEDNAVPTAVLGIASKDFTFTKGSFRLVYRFRSLPVLDPFGNYHADVDANTGEVFNLYSNMSGIEPAFNQNVESSGKGVLADEDDVDFMGDLGVDNKFRLMSQKGGDNANPPASLIAIDGRTPNYQIEGGSSQLTIFVDGNDDNFFDDPQDQIGVSFFSNALRTAEYFRDAFGWQGFDGEGKKPILLYLDQDNSWGPSNAYHLGNEIHVNSQKKSGCNCAVGLDEMAHEFTHGVVDEASGIINSGESGSINEGLADIFGTMAEFHVREKQGKAGDWLFGGDSCSNPKGKRNLQNPALSFWDGPQPTVYLGDHYQKASPPCDNSNDQCGVHVNSSIMSHWYYLLINGSGGKQVNPDLPGSHEYEVTAIDRQTAEDIVFYTLTLALRKTAEAQFRDMTYPGMREATLTVAESLFGTDSPESASLMDAWHAVGVGPNHKHASRGVSPPDGDPEFEPWTAKLSWEIKPDDGETQIQYADNPAFTDAETMSPQQMSAQGGKTLAAVNVALEPSTAYFWRVRGKKEKEAVSQRLQKKGIFQQIPASDWEDWGDVPIHYFTTSSKEVSIVSPGVAVPGVPGGVTHPWGTKVSCSAAEGAHKYIFQISEAPFPADDTPPAFALPAQYAIAGKPESQDGANFKTTYNLKVETDYYVRAAAVGPNGSIGMWSNHGAGNHFKTSKPKVWNLSAPSNGATGLYPWGIDFKWGKVDGAVSYIMLLSTSPNFSTSLHPNLQEPTNYLTTSIQKQVDKFPIYWAIQPVGPPLPGIPEGQKGKLSDTWSFTVDYDKTKPTIGSPKDQLPYKWDTWFTWKQFPPQAESYVITLFHRNPDGTLGPGIGQTNVTPPFDYVGNKPNDPNPKWTDEMRKNMGTAASSDKSGYCWTVHALGPLKFPGKPSDIACYKIGPSTPVLIAPADESSNLDYKSVNFSWDAEWAPGEFKLEISEGEMGGNASLAYTIPTINKSYSTALKPHKWYEWRVISLGPDDTKSWSDSRRFTTKEAPPPPPQDNSSNNAPQKPKNLQFKLSSKYSGSGIGNGLLYLFIRPPGCSNDDVINANSYCSDWNTSVSGTAITYSWDPSETPQPPYGSYGVELDYYQYVLWVGTAYPKNPPMNYTVEVLEDGKVVKTFGPGTISSQQWLKQIVGFTHTFD